MPYNIDETLAVGDGNHVEHHVSLAQAVNNLDSRAGVLETGRLFMVIWNTSLDAYPTSAATPPTGTVTRWFIGPEPYMGASINGVVDLYTAVPGLA